MTNWTRPVKSSLRLFRPRDVLLVVVLQVLVCSVALALSQDFAREQIRAADGEVLTCEEIRASEVFKEEAEQFGEGEIDCAEIQASMRASAEGVQRIAEEIGPPGLSGTTTEGAAVLVLGQLLTIVGVATFGTLLALTFGAESENGVADLRDLLGGSPRTNAARVFATVLVATAMTMVSVIASLVVVRSMGIVVPWDVTDWRASWQLAMKRFALVLLVVSGLGVLSWALRPVLRTRAAWLAFAGATAFATLVMRATPWWPSSAVAAAAHIGRGRVGSFIDTVPPVGGLDQSGLAPTEAVVAAIVFAGLVLGARLIARAKTEGGSVRGPTRAP
jgi:hypothetical protein